uniref:uncharacterized protein LOC122592049 n=1 Tax=Erigeron canadensis TaxID=72917 RepID=UPI001CB96417|nr:uncharacterized protein LOC122592049 [Erigeron canadensis]
MTMFEILSRTSLKTLDAIRCANKELDTITYNSYFLELYKKRNNIVSGFLVQNLKGSIRYVNHFVPSPHSETIDLRKVLPRDARILASSEQGLIFIEGKDHLNPNKALYQVCKPATRQSLEVPNPNLDYVTQKAAIVIMGLKPLRFKIVRLSQPLPGKTKYYYEIFNSKTKAWSRPYPITKFTAGAFLLDDAQEPITTGGSINMLLNNNIILKFNVYSEEWKVFSSPIIPAQKYQDYTCKRLVKFEGKLGFTCK